MGSPILSCYHCKARETAGDLYGERGLLEKENPRLRSGATHTCTSSFTNVDLCWALHPHVGIGSEVASPSPIISWPFLPHPTLILLVLENTSWF